MNEPLERAARKQAFVDALPPRVAHAVHALMVATAEAVMPCTAAEVCVYDANWEALSGRHTGAALRDASRRGLCGHAGPYWIASEFALDHKAAFEVRYLRDDDVANARA